MPIDWWVDDSPPSPVTLVLVSLCMIITAFHFLTLMISRSKVIQVIVGIYTF